VKSNKIPHQIGPEIFCVRADYGKYAPNFLKGGYTAIGWLSKYDLSEIKSREAVYNLYRENFPDETNFVVGQQVGQITRFLLEIKEGSYVITPDSNTELLHVGIIKSGKYCFEGNPADGCPFQHRKKVEWIKQPFKRNEFSVPFQNSMRAALTVFGISHRENFFQVVGDGVAVKSHSQILDPAKLVLHKILELNAQEFEILITHLLSAMGFEGAEHTGKTGDGGIDAKGQLNIAGLATISLFVQVKRYGLNQKIAAKEVKKLRQSIPEAGQGAFITTAEFAKGAMDTAFEPGFKRIGLINGHQLVDLLVEYWEKLPTDFQEKLGLKLGLVPF